MQRHSRGMCAHMNAAVAVCMWLTTLLLPLSSAMLLSVDLTTTYQNVVGAGAAFSGSTTYLLHHHLNDTQREGVMNLLFGSYEAYGGANFNSMRIVMGSCDFSLRNYTYDDLPDGTQDDFNLDYFSVANDMEYVVPMIRAALLVNPGLRIIASPWSAPAWMKVPQSLFGGVLSNDTKVRLTYAQYFRRFVESYALLGIPIFAVTVQNEPRFQTSNYPSMQLTPQDEIQMAELIAEAFVNSSIIGNTTKVIVYDHNWDDPDYPIEVLSSPAIEGNPAIIGAAFHCYAGNVVAQGVVHAAAPSKRIFFTECTGGAWAPQFSGDLLWDTSNLVIGAVNQWAESVTKWNMALDTTGGPHLPSACSNCRGVITILPTGEAVLNEDFYPLAHLSMWLNATEKNQRVSISNQSVAVAMKTPSCVVVVLQNSESSASSFELSFGVNATTACVALFPIPPQSIASVRWRLGHDTAEWVVTCGDQSQLRRAQPPATVRCSPVA